MSDDIATRTIEVIARYSGLKAEEISRDTEFDEIGIGSLDLTEVVMDVEEMFDIQIDMNAAEATETLKNVGSVVDEINRLVSAKG